MNTTVNILNFGVRSNSGRLETKGIQAAIDACFQQGGGIVQIPEGIYQIGDLRLRSNITLYLCKGAVLKGSDHPEDYFHYLKDEIEPLCKDQITDAPYVHLSTIHGETAYQAEKAEYRFKRIPGSRWNNAIIRAIDAENIAVIGEEGSFIDGCNCFDEIGEECYRGPHGMTFFNCTGVRLSGYTICNTGNWAHNLLFCKNIHVDGITVRAGHDGFDASDCTNLTIADSSFYTGDDCIAGFGNINTYVSNCTLNSSCSAFRFGATNAYIENCHIYGPGEYCFRGSLSDEEKRGMVPSVPASGRCNMLSAFTYYADYSLPIPAQPGNIVMDHCDIHNADRFLHYNYSGNETWQKHRPLASITFQNITADGVCLPITAYGDEDVKLTLTFNRVRIKLKEGFENIDLMHLCNFERVTLCDFVPENLQADHLIRAWSEGEVVIQNSLGFEKENAVVFADSEFCCESI